MSAELLTAAEPKQFLELAAWYPPTPVHCVPGGKESWRVGCLEDGQRRVPSVGFAALKSDRKLIVVQEEGLAFACLPSHASEPRRRSPNVRYEQVDSRRRDLDELDAELSAICNFSIDVPSGDSGRDNCTIDRDPECIQGHRIHTGMLARA
jgi:hypothetical protein